MAESFRRSLAGAASRPLQRWHLVHRYGSPVRHGGDGRGGRRHLRPVPECSNQFTATVLQPGWYRSVRSGQCWISRRTKHLQIRTFTDALECAGRATLELWLRRSRVRAPSVTPSFAGKTRGPSFSAGPHLLQLVSQRASFAASASLSPMPGSTQHRLSIAAPCSCPVG